MGELLKTLSCIGKTINMFNAICVEKLVRNLNINNIFMQSIIIGC